MRGLPLLTCSLLAGCMAPGDYPSLRPRAFEAAGPPGLPVPPPPPAPPASAEIVSRVAGLIRRAESGQSAFSRTLRETRVAASSAGAANSESWIAAQEAVSGLDAAREPTVSAMAELDALNASGVDAAGLRFGDNDFAAIRAAGERVYTLAVEQQRTLDSLSASLPAP